MKYTRYTIAILVCSVRKDIKGFSQQSAWAGHGQFPFGLFDCPGWTLQIRRLSDAFASARRRSHLTGVSPLLINVRPYTCDGHYAVISFRIEHLLSRRSADHERVRLERLVNRTRRECGALCQVCGRPAKPLIMGGIWCPKHAPKRFAHEVVQDGRRLRRIRRGWLNQCRGTMTKYIECYSGVFLPLYAVDGSHFVCISDAPPGARQQTLELMIDQGYHPENLEGEWLIRSFLRSKT